MARPLRIEYEGALYHVTSRGNEGRRIFFSKPDYYKFLDYLKLAQEKFHYLLHAYVLMTNHYHLLIETPLANLNRIMHFLNGSYTNYINLKRSHLGHLLQGRYKAILIDRDNYLLELSRYIHLNPVRAKLVKKPEDYPFSSYRIYLSSKNGAFVYRDQILGMITKDQRKATKKYKEFVDSDIGTKIAMNFDHLYGGIILGKEEFIKDTLEKLKDKKFHKMKGISHIKEFEEKEDPREILDHLAAHFRKPSGEIIQKDKKEMRDIGIYLLKKYTGLTNREIGQQFAHLNDFTVAKIYQRFLEKLKKEPLFKEIEEIKRNFSNGKP